MVTVATKRIERRLTGDMSRLPGGLHPVLKRAYAARGVHDGAELELRLNCLTPIGFFQSVEPAVALINRHIARGSHIAIAGDYDADGATSAALLIRTLRALGHSDISSVVPNRFVTGYGLSAPIVDEAATAGARLIITVDNGITSIAGVRHARSKDIDVLITDHHLAGAELPAANAIVNPNLPGEAFTGKHLAGVGVAFYVAAALARTHGRPEAVSRLLDLVALGTVADVVPLDYGNRILVEQGLRRIRARRSVAGIRALMDIARRDIRRAVAQDLGFAIAPRLNAAGRLEDMSIGVSCLTTDDIATARELAARLDALNRERRFIEKRMQREAETALADIDAQDDAYCFFEPGWHQGVVGLVASRMRERTHRPVIAFASCGDGRLKGSARSIPGVNVRDAIEDVATANPRLIARFGGHAMAAGLELNRSDLPAFAQAFAGKVRARMRDVPDPAVVLSDGEIGARDLTLELAEGLRNAGPWGARFPEPVFDGEFQINDVRELVGGHLKMRVTPSGESRPIQAIGFNLVKDYGSNLPERARLAYRLDVNDYRGVLSPQLVVEHIEDI